MARLIDKDASLSEIERLKKAEGWCQVGKDTADVYYARGFRFACERIKDALNTLEVKEVDLHKELDDYIERQKAWVKDDWVVEYNNGDSFNHIYDLEKIAKHFFELGLKAQKGE